MNVAEQPTLKPPDLAAPSTAPPPRAGAAARRVWLLTNAPSPYQVELLAAIDRETALQLDVRFMRDESSAAPGAARQWPFAHRVLAGLGPRRLRDEFRLHPRALWDALAARHDCYVLSGLYTSVTFLLCAALLTLRRKPWLLWLERPRGGRFRMKWTQAGLLRRLGLRVRRGVLRTLMRFSHGTIAIGTAAVETYAEMGADRSKLMMLPYCCDVTRFATAAPEAVDAVRRRHHLDGRRVFLFSGQMIQRKGVDVLIEAFTRIAAGRDDLALLLLGDGPDRGRYEDRVPPELKPHVHFAGFRRQDELPAYFRAADVFVFPSRHDGWAVVINEACGAALPVIASRQTGAAWDLVVEGENGFTFGAEDVNALAASMARFADDRDAIAAFGERSFQRVQRFSVESGARQFEQHIHATLPTAPEGQLHHADHGSTH